MKHLQIILLLFLVQGNYSQTIKQENLQFSGYGELYYSYDFSNPSNHEKYDFLYNHKRHNELNLNMLLLKANYADKDIRANLGVMIGNYSQYNLQTEPNWAQFLYEANIGIKLSERKDLWIDAGVFPSHIGFESALSADCWTLSRSILAENSPYYETGLRLSYTAQDGKLYLAALLLNGWQRIERLDDQNKLCGGMQITYKPLPKLTLNYSNFLGSNKPDYQRSFRHFHNFYLQYEPTSRFGLIAGFDIGAEKDKDSPSLVWYAPVVIAKLKLTDKTVLALRGEYYNDRDQVIIATGTENGFQTMGFSSNLDFRIHPKSTLRLEAKMYQSEDPIFDQNKDQNNFSITTNLTFRL